MDCESAATFLHFPGIVQTISYIGSKHIPHVSNLLHTKAFVEISTYLILIDLIRNSDTVMANYKVIVTASNERMLQYSDEYIFNGYGGTSKQINFSTYSHDKSLFSLVFITKSASCVYPTPSKAVSSIRPRDTGN